MQYYTDYHHHSNHSFDSKADMEEICQNAIHNGVHEICFTEHFSVNPNAPTFGHMEWEKYLNDINKCKELFKGKLTIKLGIELCEPHQMMDSYHRVLSPIPFDFILGSVHNLGGTTLRKFMNAHPEKDIYEDYFLELKEMVKNADIDVIAHFDLMKRYAFSTRGLYDFTKHKDLIADILTIAINREIGLEINTSGLRTSLELSMPHDDILKLYKELGGQLLTIGSDSHHAATAGAGFKEGIELVKACGFTHFYTYSLRKPTAVKIG
ncbi:histidinol-phosphatase HisJ family protein [Niallia sp. FSL R7-0271]|uniref:histidinol-phosphatase HisJ family protein n=1 Tax=Niallia sp. FSL R7-0271 TaxID=2921678 RepID=UPI0030F6C813